LRAVHDGGDVPDQVRRASVDEGDRAGVRSSVLATTDDKGQYTIDTKGLPDGTYNGAGVAGGLSRFAAAAGGSEGRQGEQIGGLQVSGEGGEDRGGSAEAGSRGGDRDADVWCGCLLHR